MSELDVMKLKEFADRLEYGDDPMEVARDIRVMVSGEILACPCCGGTPEIVEANQGQIQVRCTECLLTTPIGLADDVISAWNKRVKE